MAEYKVTWTIDIEAGTPEQAAKQALAIQRDTESTATVFDVALVGPCPSCHQHYKHKPKCRFTKLVNGNGSVGQAFHIDLKVAK